MSRAGPAAAATPTAVAKFAIDLLVSLRGSICLYEGEELGLPEAEIAFEDLRDPYGIRFWPAFKGRDGCRTPMPWEASAPNAGFTTGKPWLPVPEAHRDRAVDMQQGDASVLAHYRRAGLPPRARGAGRRRHRIPRGQGRRAGVRPRIEGERLLCLFNFAGKPAKWAIPAELDQPQVLEAQAMVRALRRRRSRSMRCPHASRGSTEGNAAGSNCRACAE